MHFSPLLSSAHGNPIRSGDGQINSNTLICVAHVPKLDWDRTPYTPFHLSAEWREGMERSRRGHQCSQWINSATVKTRRAETSQLSELFLPSASCLHAAQLHYGFFFVRLVWVVKHVVLDSRNLVTQQIDFTSQDRAVCLINTFRTFTRPFLKQLFLYALLLLVKLLNKVYVAPNIFAFKRRTHFVIQICWNFPNVLFYPVWVGCLSYSDIYDSVKTKQPQRTVQGIIWETSTVKETKADFK